ncbi:MAG: hypothetical protein GY694_20315 [Gammaproteobacteria bacterium]|nr:hypothetical protein [Gammaproteobacteria bacterium]
MLNNNYHLLLTIFFTASLYYSPITFAQMKFIDSKQDKYTIENKKIKESSGLACSTRDKKLLWTHNDSGHMPIIYAMNHKGKDLATFHLDGIENYDWEDMDAFQYEGNSYLLIADTGDNYELRWDYRISIIKEPKLNKKRPSSISPAWSFAFQYEDGLSYDVESVAVDVLREKILLLTKRTSYAILFELPLKPKDNDKIQVAVKSDEFKKIKNPSALDISKNGRLMSVNTYRRVHRFSRKHGGETWQYEDSLKYKSLFQPEAMCLSKSEKHYYITSERKAYLIQLKAKQ